MYFCWFYGYKCMKQSYFFNQMKKYYSAHMNSFLIDVITFLENIECLKKLFLISWALCRTAKKTAIFCAMTLVSLISTITQ